MRFGVAVAQLAEPRNVDPVVLGSIPVVHPEAHDGSRGASSRGQRHRVLIPAFEGSNPSAPAIFSSAIQLRDVCW